jgi:hypothetical protein
MDSATLGKTLRAALAKGPSNRWALPFQKEPPLHSCSGPSVVIRMTSDRPNEFEFPKTKKIECSVERSETTEPCWKVNVTMLSEAT